MKNFIVIHVMVARETPWGAEEAIYSLSIYIESFRQKDRYRMELWKDLIGAEGAMQNISLVESLRQRNREI